MCYTLYSVHFLKDTGSEVSRTVIPRIKQLAAEVEPSVESVRDAGGGGAVVRRRRMQKGRRRYESYLSETKGCARGV